MDATIAGGRGSHDVTTSGRRLFRGVPRTPSPADHLKPAVAAGEEWLLRALSGVSFFLVSAEHRPAGTAHPRGLAEPVMASPSQPPGPGPTCASANETQPGCC